MLRTGKNGAPAGDIASLLGILAEEVDRQGFDHSLLSRLIAVKTHVAARRPELTLFCNHLHYRSSSFVQFVYVEVVC